MEQKWANRSIYYQHADIVSGEALSAEVLVVAKSGAVCVPNVVLWRFTTAFIKNHPKAFLLCYKWTVRNCSSHMNVDSSHLDHVTKLVHLVHALAAQEPEESFFSSHPAHVWFEIELDWHIRRRLSCVLCCGTHVGMVGPFNLDSGAAMAPARRERRRMALILIWTWKMDVPCAVFQGFYIFLIFDSGQSEQ